MNFAQLESLFIIVEEGSLSSAARRLFVTPSALTQQMNTLEKEVGFDIFIRRRNGVSLTDAGRLFYQEAFQTAARMRAAIASARAVAREQRVFRVYLDNARYAKALKNFSLAHPDLMIRHVEVPYDDMDYGIRCVETGELDLYDWEYTSEVEKRGLQFYDTYVTRLCAVTSFRHPLAQRHCIPVEELGSVHATIFKSLFAANEILQPSVADGFRVMNTRFSPVDVNNDLEAGEVYLIEEEFVQRLCPLGQAIPLEPEIPIRYGFIYRADNELALDFLRHSGV